MSEHHPLLEAYLNGELDAEGFAAFNDWLREDPEHLRQWVFAAFLAQQLPDALASQAEEDTITDIASAAQRGQMDAQLLSMLSEMEQKADPIELPGEAVPEPVEIHDDAGSLSAHDLAAVGGYVLRKALTSKAAVYAYAAAIVLLVGVFFVPWGSQEDPTPAPIAELPAEDQSDATHVATLTAQHDAQWAEGALAPGSTLTQGQRLTLTQGLAEIRTADGAIAIIEAPATIQLINDNALHLHAGKLVGICETPSSKGFLVRTPHMDITDLGTRFGVDATDPDATEVHVLEGEVEASQQTKHADEPTTMRLVEGDAITASASADRFVSIENNDAAFAAIITFARSIPTASAIEAGIAALSGDIKWSPSTTYLDRAQWPSDERAVVFEELPRYELAADAPVTLIGPGSTQDSGNAPAHAIPAGTTVRTYIVLLYVGVNEKVEVQGSVTFDGEVLGIATTTGQASRFTDAVGGSARLAPVRLKSFHWLDPEDTAALAEDRRTVTFQVAASGPTTDAIRVFVRVPGD